MRSIIYSDSEYQPARVIAYNKYGPGSKIFAWHDTMKINQRKTLFHRKAQTAIISMKWISSSIPILE